MEEVNLAGESDDPVCQSRIHAHEAHVAVIRPRIPSPQGLNAVLQTLHLSMQVPAVVRAAVRVRGDVVKRCLQKRNPPPELNGPSYKYPVEASETINPGLSLLYRCIQTSVRA